MKRLVAMVISSLALAAATGETNQSNVGVQAAARPVSPLVHITRSASHRSASGPAEYFTGAVRIDSQFQRSAPARVGGAIVTFEPGARSAWHTHPLGQTLIVTAGTGLVQQWGGVIQEMKQGDIVWIPRGVKHWHGAVATERMTHIAIAEALEGKVVDWMEKVSDEQYRAGASQEERE